MAKNDLPAASKKKIEDTLSAHEVVLYMKGTGTFPQCGFSARVVEVLRGLEVEFHAVNVLADPEIREAIKVYADWPTIPQLYHRGKFLGGSDIIAEMHRSGDLARELGLSPKG